MNEMSGEPSTVHDHSCESCGCASSERPQRRPALPAVLIVDDDPDFLAGLEAALLSSDRCRVITADSADAAAKILRTTPVTMVIADHYLGGATGTGLLEHVLHHYPGVSRCIMSGRATKTVLAGAINRGRAHKYLPKSMAPHLLVKAVLCELPGSQSHNEGG